MLRNKEHKYFYYYFWPYKIHQVPKYDGKVRHVFSDNYRN